MTTIAPFIMVPCVLLVVFSFAAFKQWIRLQTERERSGGNRVNELISQLDRIEQRVANLETIVLEAEKRRKFDQL